MSTQMPMIDVSSNNHPNGAEIDWRKVVEAGYGAVMIKATEGIDYVNPWLGVDAHDARLAGLWVGFYAFAHPSKATGAATAAAAVKATAGLSHQLGLALDLEVTEGQTWEQLAVWAQDFHDEARKTFNHAPLYTTPWMLDQLHGAPWAERLWLPSSQRPRREVWAWQATVPADVPGIEGLTDVGYLHPDA